MAEQERHILYKIKPFLQDSQVADAVDVEVDDSNFSSIDDEIGNVQLGMEALNRLFGIVASGQPGTRNPRFQGPFVPFTNSITLDTTPEIDLYAGNTALYARSDNARVNFILPTDAQLTSAGIASDEQVEFAVLNQAGTARFDSGFTPTNTVVIDVQGSNNIRRDTPTGSLLNFIEAHQNDLVTLTQSERGEPWVAVRVTLSNAALLLPSGLFRLDLSVNLSLNPALSFIAGIPAGVTPQAGDAYRVSVGNETFGGYGVEQGDVLVALQDNPSRVLSDTNDDWLVIRNATNDIITLSEINFLNTVSETDTFEDDRLIERSDVTDVRLFLSTGILDHAPFITPSTDPNNPQSDGTRYVGGDEDVSTGNEFHLTDFTKVGEPAGSSRFPNAFMYFDIDGSFDTTNLLNQVYVVIKDAQGNEVSRHNAVDHFRAITLTGSSDTYYVFDIVGASDNYSSITYLSGYTIDVIYRRTLRHFALSDEVNALPAIADRSIPIEKLQPNVQALINANHALTDEQEAALSGLQTTGIPTKWTAGTLYVRDSNPAISNEQGHYVNVGQQNGILSNFDHSRSVVFVVPSFVSVNGLERTDDNSIKISVTRIGALTLQDTSHTPPTTFSGQGFSATLPSSSFDINNPVGASWQVDGTASNLRLTGAQSSFKVGTDNLGQDVQDLIHSSASAPITLPETLQRLNQDIQVTTRTESGWRALDPFPIQSVLTREYAAFWDENRRTFTGNYFDDIANVEVFGYAANTIFYYTDSNRASNRNFPDHDSYIENDNIRVRNTGGGTNITDVYNKIIGFDYALQREIEDSDGEVDMLRLGPAGTEPLIRISHQEGLHLRIGRGDGTQQSRTYDEHLQVDGSQWHDRVDEAVSAESEIIIPNDATGSFTVKIQIHGDNNGNGDGTHEETVTITNVSADQNLGQRTFSYPTLTDVTCDIVYDHDNNDLSVTRRVLFLRPTAAFTNAAFTYSIVALHNITETWNHPTTYADYPINAGDPHDRFGLFDPALWNTERVQSPQQVLLMLVPWRDGDESSDPEMAAIVIVDGELKGESANNYKIRLGRPKSGLTTNDVNFGNNICAVGHIQGYRYKANDQPTSSDLQTLYAGIDRWLGAFTDADETTDIFKFLADVEINKGDGLILNASNDNRYLITISDTGTLVITDIT